MGADPIQQHFLKSSFSNNSPRTRWHHPCWSAGVYKLIITYKLIRTNADSFWHVRKRATGILFTARSEQWEEGLTCYCIPWQQGSAWMQKSHVDVCKLWGCCYSRSCTLAFSPQSLGFDKHSQIPQSWLCSRFPQTDTYSVNDSQLTPVMILVCSQLGKTCPRLTSRRLWQPAGRSAVRTFARSDEGCDELFHPTAVNAERTPPPTTPPPLWQMPQMLSTNKQNKVTDQ